MAACPFDKPSLALGYRLHRHREILWQRLDRPGNYAMTRAVNATPIAAYSIPYVRPTSYGADWYLRSARGNIDAANGSTS